jgi:hypothetical protein
MSAPPGRVFGDQMRPVEHFLSQLDKIEGGAVPPGGAEEYIVRTFTGLTAPVIGKTAAADLCGALLDPPGENPGPGGGIPCLRLGYAAAFILGEFDDSMELSDGEWEEIRNTLEEAAGEMDLNTLTALMGELLERGKI